MTVVTDNVDQDEVEKPLATSQVKSLMRTSLVLGVFTAIFYLTYFMFVGTAPNALSRTNLFVFFNLTQILIILAVRSKKHFLWQGAKPSRTMLATILLFTVGSIIITYIPAVANLMDFAPLPFYDLAISIAVSVAFLFLLDLIQVMLGKWKADRVDRETIKVHIR